MGEILAVCISEQRGTGKQPVQVGECIKDFGFRGDAHAGDWHRQVSLLATESADDLRRKGLIVGPGEFGENLLTRGVELKSLPIGQRIRVGSSVFLEVTQIGKESEEHFEAYDAAGQRILTTEGVFARVLKGGFVRAGDSIDLLPGTLADGE
ncbi:MAG: MOSC domain-containing protein [Candidatus Eisenbacteria sp.]|nr:MOSC domain-containing protein [Candidatus Eisenbacteria bacterium]